MTNYILPILTLPYLVRVLGTEKFGTISLAQAIFSYLIIFTDYGFNLTTTRDIAIHKLDKVEISRIVSITLLMKILLFIVSFVLLAAMIFFIPKLRVESSLYLLGFSTVLGQVLLPIWFFQGMEQMKYLTYLNVFSKVIFTVLIFVIIHEPLQYNAVLPIYAIGNIVSGLVGIFLMFKAFKISWVMPSAKEIINETKRSFPIFMSNFSINSYVNSNIVVLGFLRRI